jgi:molecular chaperone DnaK
MAGTENICIGIDLGTTFSCAAVVRNGKPRIIPSGKGYLTVPSVVGLTRKGEIIVGQPALDQMVTSPGQTIYGSKRLVGRKYNSMIVQKMLRVMNYPIIEGTDGEAAVKLAEQPYSLEQISAFILGEVKDMAQGTLGMEVKRAVITVPAYYNDNQRQAVVRAGELAGFKVERIVNEPTAAAIAYGFNRGFDQKILVYDLGGGTFDLSILNVRGNDFRVIATGGDTFLGGVDFDTCITEYIIDKFAEVTGKDIRPEKVAVERVRAAAERAKRELSLQREANIELPYLTEIKNEPIDLRIKLTQTQLNRLTKDLVVRTIQICEQVLQSVAIKPKEIDEILLVGGQTRMPLVQREVERFFGKAPRKGVHPDEVVALGASILGDSFISKTAVALHDVLAIPVGIALPNNRFKPILGNNTPIPASKSYKLTAIKTDAIEIDIYQGESENVLEDEYLGTFCFPPPPKERKGQQRLEMKFELSADCLLSVTATDLDTGKQTSAKMVTRQTPKSLVESMKAAMAEPASAKPKWFLAFAQRVLGLRSA